MPDVAPGPPFAAQHDVEFSPAHARPGPGRVRPDRFDRVRRVVVARVDLGRLGVRAEPAKPARTGSARRPPLQASGTLPRGGNATSRAGADPDGTRRRPALKAVEPLALPRREIHNETATGPGRPTSGSPAPARRRRMARNGGRHDQAWIPPVERANRGLRAPARATVRAFRKGRRSWWPSGFDRTSARRTGTQLFRRGCAAARGWSSRRRGPGCAPSRPGGTPVTRGRMRFGAPGRAVPVVTSAALGGPAGVRDSLRPSSSSRCRRTVRRAR